MVQEDGPCNGRPSGTVKQAVAPVQRSRVTEIAAVKKSVFPGFQMSWRGQLQQQQQQQQQQYPLRTENFAMDGLRNWSAGSEGN